jgi:hypothetical protein
VSVSVVVRSHPNPSAVVAAPLRRSL